MDHPTHTDLHHKMGKIEGRVDAMESRIHMVDSHLMDINNKIERIFQILNQRIGKDAGVDKFWAKMGLLFGIAVGATTLINYLLK